MAFWILAWGHFVLTTLAFGLALFIVIDTGWDYRLVRRLGVNGMYQVLTVGSFVRALATLGLTLALLFGATMRVMTSVPYPYPAAAPLAYFMTVLLIVKTCSEWIIRRRVRAIGPPPLVPPSDSV